MTAAPAREPARGSRAASGLALLTGLFVAAIALRPQVVGAGPLLPAIEDDLHVSHAVAGLLGTIPVLSMGLFAPPAAGVAARFGTRTAIALCLAAIAVFGVARALAPGMALVLVLTLPVGIGMGVAGALMPVVVKERYAHRPAFASGVYTTGINLGAALAAALAVPAASVLGGWRGAFAAFSLVTAGLALAWIALMRGSSARRRVVAVSSRGAFAHPAAWRLIAVFALQSSCFYGLAAWLPDAFSERGWDDAAAGALVGVMAVGGLPAGLVVPWLADRVGSRRSYLAGIATALTLAIFGMIELPAAGWVWAVLAGLATSSLFPMILTLPLDVADDPGDVGAVTGLMLGAGYTLAAAGPLALGALRDATGSFDASLWALCATAALLALTCAQLSPARLRPRALARRR